MSKEKTDSDVQFIRALAGLLQESDLAEIEVSREYGEDDELKVRLSRYSAAPVAAAPAAPAPAPVAAPAAPGLAAPAAPEPTAAGADPSSHPGCVTSPMVGTAYLAPEPGADVFVAEGTTVQEGQTILIVEAMKTMNAIPSPRAGTVRKILIGNSEPVEFGSPLMIIE